MTDFRTKGRGKNRTVYHCLGCGKDFIYTVEKFNRHKKHGEVVRK